MYVARLVCSDCDCDCAEEVTRETATLRELETLLCDCGCALAVVGWPDVAAEALAEVVAPRFQRFQRPAAARPGALTDAA